MDKLNDLKNDFLNEFSKIQDLEGPSYLYDPIKYFVKSPGKRLRPIIVCLLYTSPSPRDGLLSRMPSSA